MARTVIALVIAAIGTAPIAVAIAMLTSDPDRDGVGGWDWVPVALPLAAFGALILTFAWLVHRDRPLSGPPDPPARMALALALATVGATLVAYGDFVFAKLSASYDSGPAGGLAAGLPMAVLGLGLIAVAWRHRRAPRR